VRQQVERGLYMPVLASDRVQQDAMVLVDGFKRVRGALALGLSEVLVQVVRLDAVAAAAAILASNCGACGLTQVEEALIVQELHRQHGLTQTEIAARLDRHKTWVCRRVQLLEALHVEVLEDVRVGLVTPAVAREVVRLPRGNQPSMARAAHEHRLTSREAGRLVDVLRATPVEERPAVLADPRAHLPAALDDSDLRRRDPRLGAAGNWLRFQLLRMESAANQICTAGRERPLFTLAPAEQEILAVVAAGAIEATQRAQALVSVLRPDRTEEQEEDDGQ
jgi:ParB/RepB/Spo0J family partition protein